VTVPRLEPELVPRNHTMWDTFRFLAGPVTGVFPFFTYPRGQHGKTREDTNCELGSQLGMPLKAEWGWLQVSILDGTEPDIGRLVEKACVGISFSIWDKSPKYLASFGTLERRSMVPIVRRKRWLPPDRVFLLPFPEKHRISSQDSYEAFISIWPRISLESPMRIRMDLGPTLFDLKGSKRRWS